MAALAGRPRAAMGEGKSTTVTARGVTGSSTVGHVRAPIFRLRVDRGRDSATFAFTVLCHHRALT